MQMCIMSCFIYFKLDTTFHNTSITPFFPLCFVHSAAMIMQWQHAPISEPVAAEKWNNSWETKGLPWWKQMRQSSWWQLQHPIRQQHN